MQLPVSFINFVDKLTQWVYHATDGRIGGRQLFYDMLLLQTVGRKSGQLRTHTLLYIKDNGNLVIVASNNGLPHYPAWYWNLKADPYAWVQIERRRYKVSAEEVEGEEYERLWRRFLAVIFLYTGHRKRTTRPFPILILKLLSAEE
jgi:F420H(2)-dependent quinone reductase